MDVDDVGSAEDSLARAASKFSALLLLAPRCHSGLRRLAAALVRQAGFCDGDAADFLYVRAAELGGEMISLG